MWTVTRAQIGASTRGSTNASAPETAIDRLRTATTRSASREREDKADEIGERQNPEQRERADSVVM